MGKKRRRFSPSKKVEILRELLEGNSRLSEICEQYGLHPTQVTRWKKKLFEEASNIFSGENKRTEKHHDKKMERLKSEITHKNGVIVELLEDNLRLKKNDGDL